MAEPRGIASGDIGHRPVTAAGHQPGGFAGAKNVNTADKRRLSFCAETVTISVYQVILFDDKIHRVAQ